MTEALASKQDIVRRTLVRSRYYPKVLPASAGRLFDLCIALLTLVFISPLLVTIAMVIMMEGQGRVIFAHTRIGKNGQRFEVFKFRSMREDGDAILAAHLAADPNAAAEWRRDHKLRQDPRVTRLGAFLRKSSLDELPQVLNVIRGEMSIVGPRPIVEAEISRYGRFFGGYCSVRPGITGIWQVSGRNDVSYRRRVAMDALYARRKSIALDLALIAATIPAVLSRKGAS